MRHEPKAYPPSRMFKMCRQMGLAPNPWRWKPYIRLCVLAIHVKTLKFELLVDWRGLAGRRLPRFNQENGLSTCSLVRRWRILSGRPPQQAARRWSKGDPDASRSPQTGGLDRSAAGSDVLPYRLRTLDSGAPRPITAPSNCASGKPRYNSADHGHNSGRQRKPHCSEGQRSGVDVGPQ